jgi:hypothetical protein
MSDNTSEKVVSMSEYSKDSAEARSEAISAKAALETSRDMGKAALILTVITVVLLSVFYFMLSDQIAGNGKDVEALRANLTGVGQNLAALDARVNGLENIPAKSKQMVIGAMIQEMTQKAAFLSRETADPAQKEKLDKALQLLKEASGPTAD